MTLPLTAQRITRLTPLGEALDAIVATTAPVEPRVLAPAAAIGATFAQDVTAPRDHPATAVALIDGFAVQAQDTFDAGGYAPAPLSTPPQRIDAGTPMPAGTDAVAALDAVEIVNQGRAQAHASVVPGEGVLAAGADARAGVLLRPAGSVVRAADAAVLYLLGITSITVRRPHIRLLPARAHPPAQAVCAWLAQVLRAAGVEVVAGEKDGAIEAALTRRDDEALVLVGGTGTGANDHAVELLRRFGAVTCHGVGISPGETLAFGHCGGRPVLILPGRLDAAWAAWLLVGRLWLARLAARPKDQEDDVTIPLGLTRKVTSTVGIAELVPLRRAGTQAAPLARGFVSLTALAEADAWLLVPADSEGYQAGAVIPARLLP